MIRVDESPVFTTRFECCPAISKRERLITSDESVIGIAFYTEAERRCSPEDLKLFGFPRAHAGSEVPRSTLVAEMSRVCPLAGSSSLCRH